MALPEKRDFWEKNWGTIVFTGVVTAAFDYYTDWDFKTLLGIGTGAVVLAKVFKTVLTEIQYDGYETDRK